MVAQLDVITALDRLEIPGHGAIQPTSHRGPEFLRDSGSTARDNTELRPKPLRHPDRKPGAPRPHTPAFLSNINRVSGVALGVATFGPSGAREDVYRSRGIDTDSVVRAALDPLT